MLPGAARMVVGHTIQDAGINAACGGRVFRIDVGLSKGCGNGEPEVRAPRSNRLIRPPERATAFDARGVDHMSGWSCSGWMQLLSAGHCHHLRTTYHYMVKGARKPVHDAAASKFGAGYAARLGRRRLPDSPLLA